MYLRLKIELRRSLQIGLASMLAAGLMTAGANSSSALSPAMYESSITVAAGADTFVNSKTPKRVFGRELKLVTSGPNSPIKTAYLKFGIPAAPAGASLVSARLALTPQWISGASVSVRSVASSAWSETTTTYANAPALGPVVSTGTLTRGQTAPAFFDMTAATTPGKTATYAVTASGGAIFKSRETGSAAPALMLTYREPMTVANLIWANPQPIHFGTRLSSAQLNATADLPGTITYTPGLGTKLTEGTHTLRAVFTPADPTRHVGTSKTVSLTVKPALHQVRIGMATPRSEWEARLAETGGVDSRRLFGNLWESDSILSVARSEIAAGRLPILSFKVANNDWAGVGAGKYDAALRDVAARLAAMPGKSFVTLHHEPQGDGTPANYAAMQRRSIPILGAAANVDAGPIVNGFWWSARAQGKTDAEIAQWLPADVLRLSEVVAADTYQGGTVAAPLENAGVKIARMSQWATRVGVTRLGIGEYNGLNAQSITAAGDAILADRRFAFAACFNSSQNNREGVNWTLEGDRLAAFKETVAKSRIARGEG